MSTEQYLAMVRGFGIYHALAILPLTMPILSESVLVLLGSVHEQLNLPGIWLSTEISHMMFVNLFACAACIWAFYRVFYPSLAVGKIEGWGMLLFSFIVIFYVYKGVSPLWLVIPLVDIPGGILHIYHSKISHV